MARKPRDRSLRLIVQHIQEAGEDLTVDLTEPELGEMLAGSEGAYRTSGSGAEARLHLSRTGENVFIRGDIRAPAAYTCSRCLSERTEVVTVEVQWTFLPQARYRGAAAHSAEVELTAGDLDVSFYEGEEIDLFEVIREAILLELRPYPTCPETCLAAVGDEAAAAAAAAEVDPRWLPLLDLQRKRRS
jgi:uncharacterized protein